VFGGEESIRAEKSEWTLLLEPMYMDAYGHDQHVLTIHERSLDSTPTQIAGTPVALDTEDGVAFRFELQYARSDWGMGLDFFWFNTSQGRPTRTLHVRRSRCDPASRNRCRAEARTIRCGVRRSSWPAVQPTGPVGVTAMLVPVFAS